MKKIMKYATGLTALVTFCLALSSFSPAPGAHSFQVYFDSKLMADTYVLHNNMVVPKLTLDPAGKYNEIIVKYNECGRTVSGRVVTIKDEHDNVLKEWSFEGTTSAYKDPMTFRVKDVIALKPRNSNTLKLFYSSNDFKEGQQVAYLVIGKDVTASLK